MKKSTLPALLLFVTMGISSCSYYYLDGNHFEETVSIPSQPTTILPEPIATPLQSEPVTKETVSISSQPATVLPKPIDTSLQPVNVQAEITTKEMADIQSLSYFSLLNSSVISPPNSWESDILLIGWKVSDKVGYDLSVLSEKEKQQLIETGIKVLINDADRAVCAKTNCAVLTNYYYAKNDFKKAIYWAFKGAENGSCSCMHVLSLAYMCGEQGVVQNFEEGLKWAYLGAACGDRACQSLVDTSANNCFSKEEQRDLILASQRKANDWMQEHTKLFASRDQLDERIL